MFLSKANIRKQIIHELLNWKKLNLRPETIFDPEKVSGSYKYYHMITHPDKNPGVTSDSEEASKLLSPLKDYFSEEHETKIKSVFYRYNYEGVNHFCALPIFKKIIFDRKLNGDEDFNETELLQIINASNPKGNWLTNTGYSGVQIAIETHNTEMLSFLLNPALKYPFQSCEVELVLTATDIQTLEVLINRGATFNTKTRDFLKNKFKDNKYYIDDLDAMMTFLPLVRKFKNTLWPISSIGAQHLRDCEKLAKGYDFIFNHLDGPARIPFMRSLNHNTLRRWFSDKEIFKSALSAFSKDEIREVVKGFSPAYIATNFIIEQSDIDFCKNNIPDCEDIFNVVPFNNIVGSIKTIITLKSMFALFGERFLKGINEKNITDLNGNLSDIKVIVTDLNKEHRSEFFNKLSTKTIVSYIKSANDLEWFVCNLSAQKSNDLKYYYTEERLDVLIPEEMNKCRVILSFNEYLNKKHCSWNTACLTDSFFDICNQTPNGNAFAFSRLEHVAKTVFLRKISKESLNKWLIGSFRFKAIFSQCDIEQKRIILKKIDVINVIDFLEESLHDNLSLMDFKVIENTIRDETICYYPLKFDLIRAEVENVNELIFNAALTDSEKLYYLCYTRKLLTSLPEERHHIAVEYLTFINKTQSRIHTTEDTQRPVITSMFLNILRLIGIVDASQVTISAKKIVQTMTNELKDNAIYVGIEMDSIIPNLLIEDKMLLTSALLENNYARFWSEMNNTRLEILFGVRKNLESFFQQINAEKIVHVFEGMAASSEAVTFIGKNKNFIINAFHVLSLVNFSIFIKALAISDALMICRILIVLPPAASTVFLDAVDKRFFDKIFSGNERTKQFFSEIPVTDYPMLFLATKDKIENLLCNGNLPGILNSLTVEHYIAIVEHAGVNNFCRSLSFLSNLLNVMQPESGDSFLRVLSQKHEFSLKEVQFLVKAASCTDRALAFLDVLQNNLNELFLSDNDGSFIDYINMLVLFPENKRLAALRLTVCLLKTYLTSPYLLEKCILKLDEIISGEETRLEVKKLIMDLFNDNFPSMISSIKPSTNYPKNLIAIFKWLSTENICRLIEKTTITTVDSVIELLKQADVELTSETNVLIACELSKILSLHMDPKDPMSHLFNLISHDKYPDLLKKLKKMEVNEIDLWITLVQQPGFLYLVSKELINTGVLINSSFKGFKTLINYRFSQSLVNLKAELNKELENLIIDINALYVDDAESKISVFSSAYNAKENSWPGFFSSDSWKADLSLLLNRIENRLALIREMQTTHDDLQSIAPMDSHPSYFNVQTIVQETLREPMKALSNYFGENVTKLSLIKDVFKFYGHERSCAEIPRVIAREVNQGNNIKMGTFAP